jgi:hypothetical protein
VLARHLEAVSRGRVWRHEGRGGVERLDEAGVDGGVRAHHRAVRERERGEDRIAQLSERFERPRCE